MSTEAPTRPHFQQSVYDEGYQAGRRKGFEDGEDYGRRLEKLHGDLKTAFGFVLGILVSFVTVLILKTSGVL